jgi:hypothetical protein
MYMISIYLDLLFFTVLVNYFIVQFKIEFLYKKSNQYSYNMNKASFILAMLVVVIYGNCIKPNT